MGLEVEIGFKVEFYGLQNTFNLHEESELIRRSSQVRHALDNPRQHLSVGKGDR